MAITKQKKTEQLNHLIELFKNAQGVAFAKYEKITVDEAQVVRRSLREQGMTYNVIKKTLIALAAKEAKLAEFKSENLDGMVAVIVSPDDVVLPAQALKKMKKDHFDKKENFARYDFAGAIFEGEFLDAVQATEFANTLTREESLSKIVSTLRSGPQKLHNVCNSSFQGLYNVFKNADKFTS